MVRVAFLPPLTQVSLVEETGDTRATEKHMCLLMAGLGGEILIITHHGVATVGARLVNKVPPPKFRQYINNYIQGLFMHQNPVGLAVC